MSVFEESSFSATGFSGVARLFPLPNLVLFPHVMQPLHIFEPRYRDLLEEALATDGLITMASLAPGWEDDYDGRPAVHPVGCLGRVAVHHRVKGGAYNILLVGIKRVRLVRELPPLKSFREAAVEIYEDRYPQEEAALTGVLQRKLRHSFLRVLPDLPQAQDQFDQLLSSDISLGTLTDVIAYMVDLSLADKEALLGETNVHRRAECLLKLLAAVACDQCPGSAGAIDWPPSFSQN